MKIIHFLEKKGIDSEKVNGLLENVQDDLIAKDSSFGKSTAFLTENGLDEKESKIVLNSFNGFLANEGSQHQMIAEDIKDILDENDDDLKEEKEEPEPEPKTVFEGTGKISIDVKEPLTEDTTDLEEGEMKKRFCEDCGEPISYKEGDESIKCEKCGTTYKKEGKSYMKEDVENYETSFAEACNDYEDGTCQMKKCLENDGYRAGMKKMCEDDKYSKFEEDDDDSDKFKEELEELKSVVLETQEAVKNIGVTPELKTEWEELGHSYGISGLTEAEIDDDISPVLVEKFKEGMTKGFKEFELQKENFDSKASDKSKEIVTKFLEDEENVKDMEKTSKMFEDLVTSIEEDEKIEESERNGLVEHVKNVVTGKNKDLNITIHEEDEDDGKGGLNEDDETPPEDKKPKSPFRSK